MSEFDQQFPPGWRVWADRTPSPPDQHDPIRLDHDSHAAVPRWKRELDQIAGMEPPKKRSVPLKLLVRLLIEAEDRNSTWLSDFAEDTVEIESDLHDVLLAYDRLRQERA